VSSQFFQIVPGVVIASVQRPSRVLEESFDLIIIDSNLPVLSVKDRRACRLPVPSGLAALVPSISSVRVSFTLRVFIAGGGCIQRGGLGPEQNRTGPRSERWPSAGTLWCACGQPPHTISCNKPRPGSSSRSTRHPDDVTKRVLWVGGLACPLLTASRKTNRLCSRSQEPGQPVCRRHPHHPAPRYRAASWCLGRSKPAAAR